MCAFLGPQIRSGAYDRTFYHYSLLRTLEDGFALDGHIGHANDVTPITGIWRS